MNIHEYQAKDLLKEFGIETNKGKRYYEPSQLSYLDTFIHSRLAQFL